MAAMNTKGHETLERFCIKPMIAVRQCNDGVGGVAKGKYGCGSVSALAHAEVFKSVLVCLSKRRGIKTETRTEQFPSAGSLPQMSTAAGARQRADIHTSTAHSWQELIDINHHAASWHLHWQEAGPAATARHLTQARPFGTPPW